MARRRVTVFVVFTVVIGVIGYLIISGFDDTTVAYYQKVDELKALGVSAEGKSFRVSGLVIAGTVVRRKALQSFQDTMAQTVLMFAFFNTLLAGSIAFGVVYNSARIALSERSRELASLRVLGFTRGEVSYILLGELAILTVIAIPLGFLTGYALCFAMSEGLQTDLFRIPLILDPSTYSLSAAVVVISATISGLIVRRKVDHLDLVAVLKTRE